jgi:GNAT superfamily N-acetyltransferase
VLEFRPATLDDLGFFADVETECLPDDPSDPILFSDEWQTEAAQAVIAGWVASVDAQRAGAAWNRHAHFDATVERHVEVQAALLSAHRRPELLHQVMEWLEKHARADGAEVAFSYLPESDTFGISVLTARGYAPASRERVWELDLARQRERILGMLPAARTRMRDQGITLMTLDQDRDPERYHKLHEILRQAEQDVPQPVQRGRMPFAAFMRFLQSAGLREDRTWIARKGDQVAGLSMLKFPPIRGHVRTEWTATAREFRGRGVARTLKLETLAQALDLGVARVRTENDSTNAPILHLNEDFGYRVAYEWIVFRKPLQATSAGATPPAAAPAPAG